MVMVGRKVGNFDKRDENFAKPLSLLVDGEDIVEAILVLAGKTYCYPCRFGEWVKTVISFLERLFASGVVPLHKGYTIVGCGENKVIAIPLSQDRFLAVVAREYVDGEKLARYLSGLPNRLALVFKDDRESGKIERLETRCVYTC